jgi:tRNA-specific 2-thiouridylase
MSRIVLAMSGGVDSSVAAHLLLEAGHDVTGVFMRHGETSPVVACAVEDKNIQAALFPILGQRADHKQGCCSASDAEDARTVADRLGIPFYALDLQEDFGRIIDYFVDEYTHGRTPNPCVMCNQWIKFGRLFDFADSIDAAYVATGHYARIGAGPSGEAALLRGIDTSKDQSYALFGVARPMLERMMLPVGVFEKPRIRELAAHIGLNVADKRDSQEICFVTSGHHGDFVRARRDETDTSGEIVTVEGRKVGTHPGIEGFTIGQRKGLGVAMGEPYFVVRIETESRRVIIGKHEDLARRELTAQRTNWLIDPPRESLRCSAKIRYNGEPRPATVEVLSGDRLHVVFDEPRHGVAPGQAVVCYDGDRVLGGGWIE